MRSRAPHRAHWVIAFSVFAFSAALAAQTPLIRRVDPPNWWIGLPNPMLMLTGEHLAGARVSTTTPGIRVVRTVDGLAGRYEFVWLEINEAASPGNIVLDVAAGGGRQQINFPVRQRSPAGTAARQDGGFNGFGPDDVIYLIMPDRFADGDEANNFPDSGSYDRAAPRAYHGGDLRGIQQKLPYLKDLGVTTIWITPIYQNSGRDYHGYHAMDLYAVEKHFGSLADYVSLVKAAHSQGMKVLLDIVPNHVGPTNAWLDDPPTERWLHGTRAKHLSTPSTFAPEADPHSSLRETRDIVEGWFAGILLDMGTDDAITAQYLRQNALWWAETGALDGFRIDTFPYVDRAFWHSFHADLHGAYPRFRTIGEVINSDPSVTSFFVGGKTTDGIDTGVDTIFDVPLETAIRNVLLHDAPVTQIDEVLRHDWMFPHPENLVTYFGNHDIRRFMSEPDATPQKLELAFSLILTLRGVPEIYYGDEIAMPGGEDPDNRRDFPGGFPGDTRNAFTPQGRTAAEQDMFGYVHRLLQVRREQPALRTGALVHIFADDHVLAYVRTSGADSAGRQVLMIMNGADKPRNVEIDLADTPLANARSLTSLMGSGDAKITGNSSIKVGLPPLSMNIYRVN
ncbi:MAG TPA: alpha-amylase family glycosyl hydrolase [Candidatus Binatia bacterium]|nr:alpha-amylase family glycosyl hydrolase [Candidatus Binatia bacterium]